MDTKYLKDLYKKCYNIDIYLVSLGIRPACYIMNFNFFLSISDKFLDIIPNIISISIKVYFKDEEKYDNYGLLVNVNHYQKISKYIEKLKVETERCKIQKLMGKILGYPCAGCLRDIYLGDHFIVSYNAYIPKSKNYKLIYSFICKTKDKKKQLKELKAQLLKIDSVIKPLGFKVNMKLEYRNGYEEDEFYKTETYIVE
jgi:hypothetical protein